jgi:hypothetical protein
VGWAAAEEQSVDTAFSCITAACNKAFKVSRVVKQSIQKTTVLWWTEELTVLRKRANALWRRYQRNVDDGNVRELLMMGISDRREKKSTLMEDASMKAKCKK